MEGGWELVRIGNQEGDLECVHVYFHSADITSEDGNMSFTSVHQGTSVPLVWLRAAPSLTCPQSSNRR